jgi:hypothetical protein
METVTDTKVPAVGTQIRALYIPMITDFEGIDSETRQNYHQQVVTVTHVGTRSCKNKEGVDTVHDVVWAHFTTLHGSTRVYYISDWEVVGEPETAAEPVDDATAALKQEVADLRDNLSRVQEKLSQTISFLGELNSNLNQAADDQNLCDVFENFLEEQNSLLSSRFPLVPFSFEGREIEKEFTVTRTRTITERVHVTVNAPFGTEPWRLTQMAENEAMEEYDWDVIDEDVDDMDVEES